MAVPQWRTGRIYTVTGIGVPGYSGDGGPAHKAALNGPAGLALDDADNLYIADLLNHAIRRVDAGTGIISTITGCGKAGCSGDGGPAGEAMLNSPEGVAAGPDGEVYIADSSNHRIRKICPETGIIS